jgi:amidohydrolase
MLDQAQQLKEEMIRIRRDLHQHPELSFQEVRTAKVVADILTEIGYEVRTGVGRTGVVGQLGPGTGPTIAIRADMDALPIDEAVDSPYKSQNTGVMHACGHDAHTAILLGVAHLLKQSFANEYHQWQGNVRLLFQPSEEAFDEQGVSGATAMIEDGALVGVDTVLALHIAATGEPGKLYFQDGYSLAAADRFEAWVRGDGGHGAFPHKGSDPLFMLSMILPHLYAIPSRRIDPLEPNVVSLGEIRGGTASNIIPHEVYLQGTIRCFSPKIREQLWIEVEKSFKLVETFGGSYDFRLHKGYPPMYNSPKINDRMRGVARDLLGAQAVIEAPLGMAAEDFAYMAQVAPGAMFFLGAQVQGAGNHHTTTFAIDEEVLPLGAATLAETARRFVTGQFA